MKTFLQHSEEAKYKIMTKQKIYVYPRVDSVKWHG